MSANLHPRAADSLDIHPAATIFPDMSENEFQSLRTDIRENGLIEPIMLDQEGAILDGRHRYRACQELGIEPRFKLYEGDDPVKFVLSVNLHRRHLNDDQRAMIAGRMVNLKQGRPDKTSPMAKISRESAAEDLNVPLHAVDRARSVQARGTPDLNVIVDRGELAVRTAAKLAELPPEDQQKVTSIGDAKLRKAAAREAVKAAAKPASPPPQKPKTVDLAEVLSAPSQEEYALFEPVLAAIEQLRDYLGNQDPQWQARRFLKAFPAHVPDYATALNADLPKALALLTAINELRSQQ